MDNVIMSALLLIIMILIYSKEQSKLSMFFVGTQSAFLLVSLTDLLREALK